VLVVPVAGFPAVWFGPWLEPWLQLKELCGLLLCDLAVPLPLSFLVSDISSVADEPPNPLPKLQLLLLSEFWMSRPQFASRAAALWPPLVCWESCPWHACATKCSNICAFHSSLFDTGGSNSSQFLVPNRFVRKAVHPKAPPNLMMRKQEETQAHSSRCPQRASLRATFINKLSEHLKRQQTAAKMCLSTAQAGDEWLEGGEPATGPPQDPSGGKPLCGWAHSKLTHTTAGEVLQATAAQKEGALWDAMDKVPGSIHVAGASHPLEAEERRDPWQAQPETRDRHHC
jgi:hypothetical protein